MTEEDIGFLMWLLDRPHLPGQDEAKQAAAAHAKMCLIRIQDQLAGAEEYLQEQNGKRRGK